MSRVAAAIAAAMLASGCALAPPAHSRIDEVRRLHASAQSEARIPALAPAEWARASAALDEAVVAWGTVQDAALVDHLAYVAKQRIEIARETASRVAAEAVIQEAARRR